jgi:predicted permease
MWKVFSGEVRYAVRTLARAPRFTVVAAFTLALGIGATSSIFSAVNGVLLQPLPYPDSDRIVGLWHGAPDLGYDQFGTSPGIFHQYQSENQVYEAMGLYLALERNLTEEGDAERVPATASTHGLFEVLGVQPMLGRTYTAEEATEGGPSVVVLSHGLWQRRFGGTPDILGRTMQVDGYPNEIIGVMPPGFDFGGVDRKSDLWLPLHVDLENGQPGTFSYQGVARLRPGVTPEVAVAQETALLERVRERWADAEAFINFLDAGGFHPIVHGLKEEVVGDMERPLWILLGTVGFVLLIACGNVANLFLVRAEGRQREMAVRAAMGAGRGRITGQFLAESLVLAGMGGVAGLAVAWWGTPLLLRMAPPELPRLDQISMDGSVLLFTLGVTALAALLFGMVPALRYDVPGLLGVLRYAGRGTTEGRERHHLRNALVVGQTALAMVLLVGSGLLVKSFREIRQIDPGFDTEGILTFRLSLPDTEYPGAQQPAAFHQELLDRLRALPGVEAVGGASQIPLDQNISGTAHEIEDIPTASGELPPMFWYKYATPGYFEAMGISVVAGRAFERADHEGNHGNIIVSRALADRLWPGEDVLGKRIRIAGDTAEVGWERIVGVVEDTRDHGLREDPVQVVYHAMVGPRVDEGYHLTDLSYAIRAESPTQLVGTVRRIVQEMNPNLPLAGIQTIETIVSDSIVRLTFTALALGVAAVMALILGAVGLYGVLSYVVSQRTQEIGVRMALGAQAGQVQGMVVASGARLALLGLVVGVVGAGALTRLLQGLLFGTQPLDPITFAGMSVLLLAVGFLASYLPARKAATVDPVTSMRAE